MANEPPRQILAVPVQEADAAATAGSALGTVTVEELRTALVDHHGLSENEAAAAVGLELLCAGYPPGDDWVTGADGIDMVHTIVRRRQERL